MDCRELQPGGPTDPAGSGAAGTRPLLTLLAQLRAAYREPSTVPSAMRRAQFEILQKMVRDISRVRPKAPTEPVHVHRARQYITEHLADSLKVENVAKHVGLCPQQLRKHFKHATGHTIRHYCTRSRLEIAKALLRDAKTNVTDVAFEAGFQSLSPFYRAFRKHAGQSAAEYRRGFA